MLSQWQQRLWQPRRFRGCCNLLSVGTRPLSWWKCLVYRCGSSLFVTLYHSIWLLLRLFQLWFHRSPFHGSPCRKNPRRWIAQNQKHGDYSCRISFPFHSFYFYSLSFCCCLYSCDTWQSKHHGMVEVSPLALQPLADWFVSLSFVFFIVRLLRLIRSILQECYH